MRVGVSQLTDRLAFFLFKNLGKNPRNARAIVIKGVFNDE